MKLRTVVGITAGVVGFGMMVKGVVDIRKARKLEEARIREIEQRFTVTDKSAYDVVESVIAEHNASICSVLGMTPVYVRTDASHDRSFRMSKGFGGRTFGMVQHRKEEDITCLVNVFLNPDDFRGLVFPTKEHFEKAVLEVLAHELKHVHQLVTDDMYSKQAFQVLDYGVEYALSYRHRWCELDANGFGKWYAAGAEGEYVSPPSDHEWDGEFEDRTRLYGVKMPHLFSYIN